MHIGTVMGTYPPRRHDLDKTNIAFQETSVCAVYFSWDCYNNSWIGAFPTLVQSFYFAAKHWVAVCAVLKLPRTQGKHLVLQEKKKVS